MFTYYYDNKDIMTVYQNSYKKNCDHCKFMTSSDFYAISYNRKTHSGVFIRLSHASQYAFHLTNIEHDTSNNVFHLLQAGRDFCQHLHNKYGIQHTTLLLNSSYSHSKNKKGKDHQHLWVIVDNYPHQMNTFDNVFHTVNGFRRNIKKPMILASEPYEGDLVINHDCANLSTLKNPPLFIGNIIKEDYGIDIKIKDFFIFIYLYDGHCSEFIISTPYPPQLENL